jgi:hypothetical protein
MVLRMALNLGVDKGWEMKLSELILAVGDENVQVEPVSSNLVGNVTSQKNGLTRISLVTKGMTPADVVLGGGNIGLLIWIPRDKWEANNPNKPQP